MKYILTIFLLSGIASVNAQNLITYNDSVNHFSKGIPSGWRYGPPQQPGLKLVALSNVIDSITITRPNYNINIINQPNADLNIVYNKLKRYLTSDTATRILEEGNLTINGTDFKWLIETHKNDVGAKKIDMHNFVFIAYKNNKSHILTMVSASATFDKYKPLFSKVASTFTL